MLTLSGVPDELENTYKRFKDLSKEIFSHVQNEAKPVRISPNTCLFNCQTNHPIVYIQEGYFKLSFENKTIRLYSDGDFVDAHFDNKGSCLDSEFVSYAVYFDRERFQCRLHEDSNLLRMWLELGRMENQINLRLLEYCLAEEVQAAFRMKQIHTGEVIIREGAEPTEILEMIDGEAEVTRKGQIIGRIAAGEIFGEIGFLTGTTRTATVIAKTRCTLRTVGKDDFLALVKSNPDLGITISKTLAKRIIELNNRFPAADF